MANDEQAKDKIKRLIREAAPAANVADFTKMTRKRSRRASHTPPAPIQIIGNNSAGVIGNHNHVEIKVYGRFDGHCLDDLSPGELAEVMRHFKR